MFAPVFVTELATTTPMYSGTSDTGGALLPELVTNDMPQESAGVVAGSVETSAPNPLNANGAMPPDSALRSDQSWLHQVTDVSAVAAATVESPSTNAPRSG